MGNGVYKDRLYDSEIEKFSSFDGPQEILKALQNKQYSPEYLLELLAYSINEIRWSRTQNRD